MRIPVDTALELLREADPARNGPPTRPEAVDRALRAIPHTAMSYSAIPRRRRREHLRPALVALAVVAVVGLVGSIVSGRLDVRGGPAGQPSGPAAAEPSYGPQGTVATSDDPNFASTLQRVQHALTVVPTPPGAVRVGSAPERDLEQPAMFPLDGNLIDRAAWWTAPGTVAGVLAFYATHPPTGMRLSATSDNRTITFEPDPFAKNLPGVQISVVTSGSGVAIRADAMAIWIPTSSATASASVGQVDSVDITVSRPSRGPASPSPGTPTVHQTLTGEPGQRLANAVDALAPATPRNGSCPAYGQGFTDKLVFHAPGRTVEVVSDVGGCPQTTVTVNGASPAVLAGSVDSDVLELLALLATYGS